MAAAQHINGTNEQNLRNPPALARTATYLVGGGGNSPPLFLDHLSTADVGDASLDDGDKVQHSRCEIYGGSRKGAKTFQEDSYFHYSTANNKCIIGGVMDGHGMFAQLLIVLCVIVANGLLFTVQAVTTV